MAGRSPYWGRPPLAPLLSVSPYFYGISIQISLLWGCAHPVPASAGTLFLLCVYPGRGVEVCNSTTEFQTASNQR